MHAPRVSISIAPLRFALDVIYLSGNHRWRLVSLVAHVCMFILHGAMLRAKLYAKLYRVTWQTRGAMAASCLNVERDR